MLCGRARAQRRLRVRATAVPCRASRRPRQCTAAASRNTTPLTYSFTCACTVTVLSHPPTHLARVMLGAECSARRCSVPSQPDCPVTRHSLAHGSRSLARQRRARACCGQCRQLLLCCVGLAADHGGVRLFIGAAAACYGRVASGREHAGSYGSNHGVTGDDCM